MFKVGQTIYKPRSRKVEEFRTVQSNNCDCCGHSLGRSYEESRFKWVFEIDEVTIYALGPPGIFIEMFKRRRDEDGYIEVELISHYLNEYWKDRQECKDHIEALNSRQDWSEWTEFKGRRNVGFYSDYTGIGSAKPGDEEWNEVDVK